MGNNTDCDELIIKSHAHSGRTEHHLDQFTPLHDTAEEAYITDNDVTYCYNKNLDKLKLYANTLIGRMYWRGFLGEVAHFDCHDVLQSSFIETLDYFRGRKFPHNEEGVDKFIYRHFTNRIHTYISNEARKAENKNTVSEAVVSEDHIQPVYTDEIYLFQQLVREILDTLSHDPELCELFWHKYVLGVDEVALLSERMSSSESYIRNLSRRLRRTLRSSKSGGSL